MVEKQTSEEQETDSQNAKEMLQEERYLWMARAFAVMLVLAVICDIVLLIALGSVTPVMRVQPFYIEMQNREQQVISVSRPSAEVLNSDALQQSLVREYLLARFGVGADLKELEKRWGPDGTVATMSSDSVFKSFKDEADEIQKLAKKENFTREVIIRNVNKKVGGKRSNSNRWFADLTFMDQNRASVRKEERKFKVELVTEFRPTRKGVTWERRLENPLGFTVVNFGLTADNTK